MGQLLWGLGRSCGGGREYNYITVDGVEHWHLSTHRSVTVILCYNYTTTHEDLHSQTLSRAVQREGGQLWYWDDRLAHWGSHRLYPLLCLLLSSQRTWPGTEWCLLVSYPALATLLPHWVSPHQSPAEELNDKKYDYLALTNESEIHPSQLSFYPLYWLKHGIQSTCTCTISTGIIRVK